jgi:hypothetical protein
METWRAVEKILSKVISLEKIFSMDLHVSMVMLLSTLMQRDTPTGVLF